MKDKIAIVGAGFSGAVIAQKLAEDGYRVDVFDSRNHVGGNCHTSRDETTGVMLHVYGPHIFHTSDKEVWDWVNQFDDFQPFVNRVKCVNNGKVFSLPINLDTICSVYGKKFSPTEARSLLIEESVNIKDPKNFEEQALSMIGRRLYEKFFKDYTIKQWGVNPVELPASILKRLPVRFNFDDNYFNDVYQGIPKNGYSHIVSKLLESDLISLNLNTSVEPSDLKDYSHIFYSGKLDEWFGYCYGNLKYRTLDFKKEIHSGDYQGNAVINFTDMSEKFTRISEHKHFAPWEEHQNTVIYKEYSREANPEDIPYYPKRLNDDKQVLSKYVELAQKQKGITFVGRLGTYRYLDMHITIREALDTAELFLHSKVRNESMPVFLKDIM